MTARAMLGAVSWRRCRGSGVHHLGMPVILLVVLLGSALLVREKGLVQRVISLPGQSSPDRGLSSRSAKLGASSAADGNQRQSLRRLGFRGGSSRQAQATNPHFFEYFGTGRRRLELVTPCADTTSIRGCTHEPPALRAATRECTPSQLEVDIHISGKRFICRSRRSGARFFVSRAVRIYFALRQVQHVKYPTDEKTVHSTFPTTTTTAVRHLSPPACMMIASLTQTKPTHMHMTLPLPLFGWQLGRSVCSFTRAQLDTKSSSFAAPVGKHPSSTFDLGSPGSPRSSLLTNRDRSRPSMFPFFRTLVRCMYAS